MSDYALVTSTDVGTAITGTVGTNDASVDMTTINSAGLLISGVGLKPASIISKTLNSAVLSWAYDGSLAPGSYPCWWRITFGTGSRTAPTGSSMTIEVASAT